MAQSSLLNANFGTRRQFGRRQTNWHGWVRVRGRPVIACVVKDFSPGGALVEFDVPEGFPDRFQLTIESEKFQSDCEIRHRETNRIGVQFVAPEVVEKKKVEPDRFTYAALLAEAQKEQEEDLGSPLELLKSDPLL